VVRSDGRIALPPGSAAFDEQCQRLRSEGVVVASGRVRNRKAAPDVDEQVWGPPG
jgi:methylated-DNA-protein-cysteine methyltransferase-like protein